jgi:hypothetical protein
MNRIFPVLAAFALAALVGTVALGLAIADVDGRPEQAAVRVHFLAGLATALLVVMVESIIVTWFIGTGRWCREVAETYHLDAARVRESARLKRRAFPWAVLGMLTVVGIAALGAAADPAAAVQARPPLGLAWSQVHLAGALVGTTFIAGSFVALWMLIDGHRRVIAQILDDVRRIREEKGLPV